MNTATKLAAAVATAFAMTGAAQAAPIGLPLGPVGVKFNNLEQISNGNAITFAGPAVDPDGPGPLPAAPTNEGNWGVVNVSTMQFGQPPLSHTNTNFSDFGLIPVVNFFSAGAAEITGIFYGIQVDPAPGPLGTYLSAALGGYLDLYWDDTPDASVAGGAGGRTGQNTYPTFTDGTLLARIAFATGEVQGNSTNTVFSDIALNSLSGGFTGSAFSYGNIVDVNGDGVINSLDGAWAGVLNGDWFNVDTNADGFFGGPGETRDIKFQNNFEDFTSWNGGVESGIFGASSFDPVKAFVVPEPGSLALLGAALLGAGWMRRRKQSSK